MSRREVSLLEENGSSTRNRMTKLEEDLTVAHSAKLAAEGETREELNCADEREQSLECDLDRAHSHISELEEQIEKMRSELESACTVSSPVAVSRNVLVFCLELL